MQKKYWLMKTEPTVFSFTDLKNRRHATDHWEGVRNYQARNFMRDEMRRGDLALFYHSNCDLPGVVGIVEVTREACPDHTAWDPASRYYDPQSTPEKPRWFMVDVTWRTDLARTVSLQEMKQVKALRGMKLLQKGQRLSVMPVTGDEFDVVVRLGRKKS